MVAKRESTEIHRETERCENKVISRTRRSLLGILNRIGMGKSSPSLKLVLESAAFPSRSDEVCPDEDVSGEQHAEDELEEKDELLESFSAG